MIRLIIIKRNDMHRIERDFHFFRKFVTHFFEIAFRKKHFVRISVAGIRVYFAALRFRCGYRGDIVRRVSGFPIPSGGNAAADGKIAVRHKVQLKRFLRQIRFACHIHIQFDTAVAIAGAIRVYINFRTGFFHVYGNIHALSRNCGAHADYRSFLAVRAVDSVQPIDIFVYAVVKFAVNLYALVHFRLYCGRISPAVSVFIGYVGIFRFAASARAERNGYARGNKRACKHCG